MEDLVRNIGRKVVVLSMIAAAFIIYPNLICLPWELPVLKTTEMKIGFWIYFAIRFLYFWGIFVLLTKYNFKKALWYPLKKRFLYNLLICTIGYSIFICLYMTFKTFQVHEFMGSILIFQFIVVCCISTLSGHIIMLYIQQKEKEDEIQRLKMENMKSRCDALANQINPHFFFNSLGGISSLIRKKDDERTLQYVDELSDIFRYILQSDKKGLVPLQEEMKFVEAFRYVMEVRFANKLSYAINVSDREARKLKIPVLALLPLLDNVVVHNCIDIDHKMVISITLNDQGELVVSNPIYPKLTPPKCNGTGIKNVESRFMLLTGRKIRVETSDTTFTVYLPLK